MHTERQQETTIHTERQQKTITGRPVRRDHYTYWATCQTRPLYILGDKSDETTIHTGRHGSRRPLYIILTERGTMNTIPHYTLLHTTSERML